MKLRRTSDLILRAVDEKSSKMKFSGYALKFNQPTTIKSWCGDFTEEIDRSAFDTADISDVVLNFNHNMSDLLARTTNGSLILTIDDIGLKVDGEIIDTALGRDVYKMMQEGLITKMSFQTEVVEDKWNEEEQKRTLTAFGKFFDVSAVTFPAYEETQILAQRDADSLLQEHFKKGEESMSIKRKENIKDEKEKDEEIEGGEEQEKDEEIERGKNDELKEENKKLKEENEELKKKIKDLDADEENKKDEEDGKKNTKSKEKRNLHNDEILMRGAMEKMNLNKTNVYNTIEYRDAFFERLRGGKVTEEKFGKEAVRAITTLADPGKMFVPQIFIDEVVERVNELSLAGICNQIKETGVVTVPLEKRFEGTKKSTEDGSDTTPVTVEVVSEVLKVQMITAVIEVTKEIEKMSLNSFINYLKKRLVDICVYEINKQILNGEKTDGVQGILKADADYVTKVTGKLSALPQLAFNVKSKIKTTFEPTIVMNASFFDNAVNTLKSTDGQFIYTRLNEKGESKPYFCNMPVKLVSTDILAADGTDHVKPAFIVGDFENHYWLNMPFDIEEPERNMSKSSKGIVQYIADVYAAGRICAFDAFAVGTLEAE